jgi:uncharacterized protein (DUF58 family)
MFKSRAVFIVLLLCCGVAAYFFDSRLGYTPLLFLLFLAVIDAVFTLISRLCIKMITPAGSKKLTRGERVKIIFNMQNIAPVFIIRARAKMRFYGENIDKPYAGSAAFIINPKSKVDTWLEITPIHVGIYQAEITKIKVYGLLGVFSLSFEPKLSETVFVIPRINDEDIGVAADNNAEDTSPTQGAVIEQNQDYYNGVREYAPGDPMHSIHWKLTARNSKYMTRLYDNEDAGSLTVLLDLRLPPHTGVNRLFIYDKLLETAVTVINQHVANNEQVNLVYYDGDGVKALYTESQDDIPEISAVLVSSTAPASKIKIDINDDSAVIITANTDKELAISLAEQKSLGGHPALIFIAPFIFYSVENSKFFKYLDLHFVDYKKVLTS